MTDGSEVPAVEWELFALAVDVAREAGELTLGWFDRDDLAVDHQGRRHAGHRGRPGRRAPDPRAPGRRAPRRRRARRGGGGVAGTTGRRWIIDPIDGTKAFTRGVPLYSTLLALDDEHGPVVGVIDLPALGTIVYAGRGLGCFRDGEPVHVSATADPAEAWLSTSGYSCWPDADLLGVKRAGCQLRTWGDGYGYAMVATGRIDVMVDPEVSL